MRIHAALHWLRHPNYLPLNTHATSSRQPTPPQEIAMKRHVRTRPPDQLLEPACFAHPPWQQHANSNTNRCQPRQAYRIRRHFHAKKHLAQHAHQVHVETTWGKKLNGNARAAPRGDAESNSKHNCKDSSLQARAADLRRSSARYEAKAARTKEACVMQVLTCGRPRLHNLVGLGGRAHDSRTTRGKCAWQSTLKFANL